MIIGLFWGLAFGALVALLVYWLMRQRLERLLSALQNNQRRSQQLESEHEIRLRAATDQLQSDYERQLAEKIEYYQDHQILQVELMELDFTTRIRVLEHAFNRELETPI
ncbi:MAG: hypothetical protein WBA76_17330 [Phormidesmis sp.]